VAANRYQFMQKVKFLRPTTKKIVLISPDHFSTNQKQVSYTDVDWNLSNGKINYDHSFDSSGLTANNQLLKSDHGIYNILPDVKKYFPKATVVPILIGQQLSIDDLNILYQKIDNYCQRNCLLIASIDFSHYLPAQMANAHDSYTLDALYNKNLNKIFSSEVDSPQSLYIVSKFAFAKNTKFSLFDHTNSGYLINNPDIETTTHLFGLFNRFPNQTKFVAKTKLDLPYQIDQKLNLNSLGIRFFYGFDEISANSTLPDFAIITTEANNKTVQSYFPIINQKGIVNFVRGEQKANLIKNYFNSISNPNITKDYFWGTIFYERNK
jgi:poly-gamma-glutamate synthesis protein (capsule biosynthesis protein)